MLVNIFISLVYTLFNKHQWRFAFTTFYSSEACISIQEVKSFPLLKCFHKIFSGAVIIIIIDILILIYCFLLTYDCLFIFNFKSSSTIRRTDLSFRRGWRETFLTDIFWFFWFVSGWCLNFWTFSRCSTQPPVWYSSLNYFGTSWVTWRSRIISNEERAIVVLLRMFIILTFHNTFDVS